MAQARKAGRVQSKINMILFGDYFTGKSTLGIQMAMLKNPDGSPFRLLVIDAEQGGCDDIVNSLEDKGVNLENIYIVYTQSLEEVNHYIELASKHQDIYELDDDGEETDTVLLDADGKPFHPDAILVDGTSVLKLTSQQSLLNLARKRAKIKSSKNDKLTSEERRLAVEDAQLSQREWGALNYSGQSLVLNLAASGLHWVITCREKAETENVKIDGKMETVNTGRFIPDSFKSVGYNAKTICRMYRNSDEPDVVRMFVEKDRTGVFEGGSVVEDPSMLAFQPMIDRKVGKDLIVRNTMEQAVEKEGKLYQKSLGIEDEDEAPVENNAPAKAPVVDTAKELESKVNELKKIIKGLDATHRAEFSTTIKKRGLPTKPADIESIEVADQMIEIAKSISK